MSQTHDEQPETDESAEQTPIEETPAAAGGKDDTTPEQGEGAQNSF
ncbi:hypothetical protein [Mobilicoccus massiliensis]|nr:hypothetical protein [Mobilicoccus massiliensis]